MEIRTRKLRKNFTEMSGKILKFAILRTFRTKFLLYFRNNLRKYVFGNLKSKCQENFEKICS